MKVLRTKLGNRCGIVDHLHLRALSGSEVRRQPVYDISWAWRRCAARCPSVSPVEHICPLKSFHQRVYRRRRSNPKLSKGLIKAFKSEKFKDKRYLTYATASRQKKEKRRRPQATGGTGVWTPTGNQRKDDASGDNTHKRALQQNDPILPGQGLELDPEEEHRRREVFVVARVKEVIMDLLYAPPGLDVGQCVYDSERKGSACRERSTYIHNRVSTLRLAFAQTLQAGFSGHPFGLQMNCYHRAVDTPWAVISGSHFQSPR